MSEVMLIRLLIYVPEEFKESFLSPVSGGDLTLMLIYVESLRVASVLGVQAPCNNYGKL